MVDRNRHTRERWNDPSGNTFEWSEQTRVDAYGVRPPLGGATLKVVDCKGTYNNCDVYVAADTTWTDAFFGGPVLLSLYALVGNDELPIMLDVDPTTLPDFAPVGFQWHVYALSARGRVCDGYRVKLRMSGAPLADISPDSIHQGQVLLYAWGKETAAADQVTVTLAPGQAVNATIVAPIPVPVEVENTVDVVEAPPAAWFQQNGTAPDNSTDPFAPLAAGTPKRYVEISADSSNTGILYVAASALAAGDANQAAYELFGGAGSTAGDSVRIEIDSAAKVFVGGSDGAQLYRVAIV